MIDELEIDEAHAEAVIEKAIEFDVYSEEMPDTEKDKIEAAHEIIAFSLDSYIDDEVRETSNDEGTAEAGAQILELIGLAGISLKVAKKGGAVDIIYGDLPDIDDSDDDDEEEDDENVDLSDLDRKGLKAYIKDNELDIKVTTKMSDDDIRDAITEATEEEEDEEEEDEEDGFDPESIIEGFDGMSVKDVIAAFDSGELDEDDIAAIKEYEENEGKKRKGVLNWEPAEDEEEEEEEEEDGDDNDDDAEEEEDEEEDDEEEEDEDGDEELSEPYEGYLTSTQKDIKSVIQEYADLPEDDDDRLTLEQAEGILYFEENHEEAQRAGVVKFLKGVVEKLREEEGADEEDDEEPEGDGEGFTLTIVVGSEELGSIVITEDTTLTIG